jgi:hypothetical protein
MKFWLKETKIVKTKLFQDKNLENIKKVESLFRVLK